MIDAKKIIFGELKKISENVTDTYPDDWKKFPCIQFLEEENIPQEITDDTERMSYIRYKVDIWDKVSTTAAALQINAPTNHTFYPLHSLICRRQINGNRNAVIMRQRKVS